MKMERMVKGTVLVLVLVLLAGCAGEARASGDTTGSAAHNFFPGCNLKENITGCTAEFFRITDPEETDISSFFVKFPWKLTLFLPFIHTGNNFFIDESCN